MSFQFPEAPLLLYPSLIEQVGAEAAVLLTLYQQQLERIKPLSQAAGPELVLARQQWLALGRFWSEEHLAQLTSQLVESGLIDARFMPDGRVSICRVNAVVSTEYEADTQWQKTAASIDEYVQPEGVLGDEVEVVSRLPVIEDIPPAPPLQSYQEQNNYQEHSPASASAPYAEQRQERRQAQSDTLDTPYYPDNEQLSEPRAVPVNPGPAPTFGGSIGWARKAQDMREGRQDELQAKFFQQEQLKRQLQSMELGWQPSQNFYALLPRHNISVQFAHGCLDEFVLYWLDKDRKETNWDQKFLAWVKREWVKKQTQESRNQRLSSEHKTGFSHENPRRDTRENRKRVTAAVMDIKDTDW